MADQNQDTITNRSIFLNGDTGEGFFVVMTPDDKFYAMPLQYWLNWSHRHIESGAPRAATSVSGATYDNMASFGPHMWEASREKLRDAILLCNKDCVQFENELGLKQPIPGLVSNVFAPFRVRTRWPMWKEAGRDTIGQHLLVPYQQTQIDAFHDIIGDMRLGGIHQYDIAQSWAQGVECSDKKAVTAGFNPATYPLAYELTKVTCMNTALAIASVSLTPDTSLHHNPEDANEGLYRDRRKCNVGLGSRPMESWLWNRRSIWSTLSLDEVELVLEPLVKHAMHSGKREFCASLCMRGVCKEWKECMDTRFTKELHNIFTLIRAAKASHLITDWIDLREPCRRNGLLAWDCYGELQTTWRPGNTSTSEKRVILHSYMRLKTGKHFQSSPDPPPPRMHWRGRQTALGRA